MKKLTLLIMVLLVMAAGNAMAWDWDQRLELTYGGPSEDEYWVPNPFQFRAFTDRYYAQVYTVGDDSWAYAKIAGPWVAEIEADSSDHYTSISGYFPVSGDYGFCLKVSIDPSIPGVYARARVNLDAP